MHNLNKDNNSHVAMDGPIQEHIPDCEEIRSANDAVCHITRNTLYLIVTCPNDLFATEYSRYLNMVKKSSIYLGLLKSLSED